MPKYLIAMCLTASALAACGTPPILAMPDGRTRVPINAQGAIDEHTAAAAREAASAQEEAQQRQLAAVKRDLAELKALMAELSPHPEELPTDLRNPLPARATTGRPGSSEPTASPAKYRPSETVRIRDRSTLFRITQGVGETWFAPSTALQQALLREARHASRIEIWGATDANKATAESARIAKARAENARNYLLDSGIELGRIKTTYLAARGFIADNSTTVGKASNRRVEIEVIAPDLVTSSAKD